LDAAAAAAAAADAATLVVREVDSVAARQRRVDTRPATGQCRCACRFSRRRSLFQLLACRTVSTVAQQA